MVIEKGRQLHQPRLSELVADVLRQQILDGQLTDGELLPTQEHLLAEFRISMPSLREALRTLEAEGLITVRRGNIGGSVVHRPKERHAAYTLALVLQGLHVNIADVAEALRELESKCAGMCALREDRHQTVVPILKRCNDAAREVLDDHLAFVEVTSEFHQNLLAGCGNQTMEMIAGSVETLWLAHVQEWAESTQREGRAPTRDYRSRGLRVHERITTLIARGSATEVMTVVREHFDPNQFDTPDMAEDRAVEASMLRSPGHVFRPAKNRAAV